MTAIKLYLDEDVHHLIAQALRLRGWTELTTVEAGRQGSFDLEQLHFATASGYTMLTYNVADFPRLHYELIRTGEHHAGIIVPRKTTQPRMRDALGSSACSLRTTWWTSWFS